METMYKPGCEGLRVQGGLGTLDHLLHLMNQPGNDNYETQIPWRVEGKVPRAEMMNDELGLLVGAVTDRETMIYHPPSSTFVTP